MINKSKKEITNSELLMSMNRSFSRLEERMATKENLLKIQIQTNSIESDLKSFKKDVRENFKEVNEKLDDISETASFYDKRIEKLEDKV